MNITDSTVSLNTQIRRPAPKKPEQAETSASSTPADTVDFTGGHRPAHRNVKKIARGLAGAVALGGVGKSIYDIATSGSLAEGATKVALNLAMAGAGVLAVDLGTGFAHHWGDNYGLPDPKPMAHTQWHTDTDDTNYCLVGFSNSTLDKMEFWPKWERLVHNLTGKEPLSWKVEPHRQYVAGEIDRAACEAKLVEMGIHSDKTA